VDVTVTVSGQTSATSNADQFTYTTSASTSPSTSGSTGTSGNSGSGGSGDTGSSGGDLAYTAAPTVLPWLVGLGLLMILVGLLGRRLIPRPSR
jgi:hypothetical protein